MTDYHIIPCQFGEHGAIYGASERIVQEGYVPSFHFDPEVDYKVVRLERWPIDKGLVHFRVQMPVGDYGTITAPGPLPIRLYSMTDETTKDELLWSGTMNVPWNVWFTLPQEVTVQEGWIGMEVDWPGYADTWWPTTFTTIKTYEVDEWDRVWDGSAYVDGVYEVWLTQVLPLASIRWYWRQISSAGTAPMPEMCDVVECTYSVINTSTSELIYDAVQVDSGWDGMLTIVYLPPIGTYALDIEVEEYSSFWGAHAGGTVPTYVWTPTLTDLHELPTFWIPNSFDADAHVGDADEWSTETDVDYWYCVAVPSGEGNHPFPGAEWTLLSQATVDPAAAVAPWECSEDSLPIGQPFHKWTFPDFSAPQVFYLLQSWTDGTLQHGGYHYIYVEAHQRHYAHGSSVR